MKIVNSTWSPRINYLMIECDCGYLFPHRADRWRVVCKLCNKEENLQSIRDRYVKDRLPSSLKGKIKF